MKSINAKRIAAVAASVLMGLAFAGSGGVTWSNIPIISNSGQPVVQVVVGSSAAPSDGVVAANIAAVLGNLAFTSQNVTATPSGLSNVKCVVTTPTCTLTAQEVWFGEKGFVGPSGSYTFSALIGSVLNGGIQYGSPQSTKQQQTGTSYAFSVYSTPSELPVATSPPASPFSALNQVPYPNSVGTSNGGGLSFNGFRNNGYDNVLQVTPTQLASLVNNWGTYGETENLWLTGFPVYDQQTNANPSTTLADFDAGGAYQVTFNKPIPEPYYQSTANTVLQVPIVLFGKNYTILNVTALPATVSGLGTQKAVLGGKLSLAASLSNWNTVYVGHNVSSNNFTVEVTDLGQTVTPATGASYTPVAVDVFYHGNLTANGVTTLAPKTVTKFTQGGHSVYVDVNQTFAGLYAYQKWAQIKLYSNVFNFTGTGGTFNVTGAGGWNSYIYWTNGTSTGSYPNQLQSIVIYNNTPPTLTPGQTFTFVAPNFTAYKVNFVGSSLSTSQYDPVTFALSTQTNVNYQNNAALSSVPGLSINNITQPAQVLTITSQIPGAFTTPGQVGASSSVAYDLSPYKLAETANTLSLPGNALNPTPASGLPVNVVVSVLNANIIPSTVPSYVNLNIRGYQTQTSTSYSTITVPIYAFAQPVGTAVGTNVLNGFSAGWANSGSPTSLYNVTNIWLSTSLPGVTVTVDAGSNTFTGGNTLAQLTTVASPQTLLAVSGKPYQNTLTSGGVTYNQQNGQAVINQGIVVATAGTTGYGPTSPHQYFTVNVPEYNVPSSQTYQDALGFSVVNSTASGGNGGQMNWGYELNNSVSTFAGIGVGTRQNMTYQSSQVFSGVTGASNVNAAVGFMTERGSKVAQISTNQDTIDLATTPDLLQFVVTPSSTVVNSTTTSKKVGPVGVGQAVPGFANLTVSAVNATCAFSSTSCTVSGLANVTATPSVTSAVVPVSLNTATTPLVVLDSNANSAATLVVVGSKYVNSVAAQVFAQNPTLNSSFGPTSVVVQAYGTNRILVAGYTSNQTVQAGNQFINDLLQSATK